MDGTVYQLERRKSMLTKSVSTEPWPCQVLPTSGPAPVRLTSARFSVESGHWRSLGTAQLSSIVGGRHSLFRRRLPSAGHSQLCPRRSESFQYSDHRRGWACARGRRGLACSGETGCRQIQLCFLRLDASLPLCRRYLSIVRPVVGCAFRTVYWVDLTLQRTRLGAKNAT